MQRRTSRSQEPSYEMATEAAASKPTETTLQNKGSTPILHNAAASPEADQAENDDDKKYLTGWKLHSLSAALWISLFLSTLETTIVSTSLVSITDALDGFILRDWIVTSYLLTYTGFLTIYAKLSDVFGKKTMLLLALFIFTLFSGLCGAANNVVDLIILRAFQGIGASGIYAMILAIAPSLVPITKYAKYMGVMSTVFITASVFLLKYDSAFMLDRDMLTQDHSLPGGAIAFVMVCFFLPASEESSNLSLLKVLRVKFRRSNWVRIDVLGIILLLAASVLLVFALEEGDTRYSWSNAIVIATLALAVALFIAFVFWEVYVEKSPSKQEPVFPPSICKDRISSAMLLTTCFVGFPFVSMVVNIPQRAQAVYGMSPSRAGIILLPMMLTSPAATVLSGYLTGNAKVPPAYLIIIAAVLQILGVGLTCSLSTDTTDMPDAQYGYEVLMGVGFGMGLATVLTFARVVVSEANLPVMMGALTQIRVLGGTVSLAICATRLNNHIKPKLNDLVSSGQAAAILDSVSAINDLDRSQQLAVRKAFAEGYNLQNIFMTVMSAAEASYLVPQAIGETQIGCTKEYAPVVVWDWELKCASHSVADNAEKCSAAFDDVTNALSKCVGLNSSFELDIRNEHARFRSCLANPEHHISATSSITFPHYISKDQEDNLSDLLGLLRYASHIVKKEKNSLEQLSSTETGEGCENDTLLREDMKSIVTDMSHCINAFSKYSRTDHDELCYHGTHDVGETRSTSPDSCANDDGEDSCRNDGNGYFLPDCSIDREVITKDICHYLGENASVRLGYCEAMIKRLQEDSKRWVKLKNEAKKPGDEMAITRSDAIAGVNVIQQIPETSQPPHCHCRWDEGRSRHELQICPRGAFHNPRRSIHTISLRPDYPDVRQESIPRTPYVTTSPNIAFTSSPALPAIAGAIDIAATGQAKINSGVEVSNTTAAWIFGAVAAVTNGVTAFATRETAKASKRSAIAGEVAANASKRSAKAAEETCLIAQKHFEAIVKDSQDPQPPPDTGQNISGAAAETSSRKQQKSDTGSRPVVPHGTEMATSPLYVPPAVLPSRLPQNTSSRGRLLRTMSNPTLGRREKIDTSLDLLTAREEAKIVWPEVPTCEFGKPCNCNIIPKY
ncbi:multidrug transporter [Fusarium napiforme]|uniref:Multidrug transporter n=1 Tax=Fusarium napiforme TaxID=42672 RepID=A0A8H5J4A5_9HYPO|nr:multidrug transporter [Fusarium napiforme]